MNILITGGAGYIGGALTDLLQNSKHKVRVYDSLLYEENYRKDVEFIFGDIRDQDKLLKQLKWADAVVWLAALVGDGACALNPDVATDINQQSVKWLSDNFDGRIIFTSTCSVYGAQEKELDETSPTNPLSVYASTKLASEEYLIKKNALIFRLGTLFGVGDQFSRIRLDLVVNIMIVRACKEGELKIFGGEQYRPLLHVRDSARAIFESLDKKETGIFNLNKENVKILELAKTVKKHFPKLKMQIEDMKFEDSRNYRVKNDKAKKILKFEPAYTIDQGIEELKQLLTENRIRDVNNERYANHLFLTRFNTHLEKI
ncbi:NAD(P)-dependent oxidoreductase [Patescibacteria group bacterium]|nr:NAD(P)-dependent oxidoreductase [Patescibacteria group bacterium]